MYLDNIKFLTLKIFKNISFIINVILKPIFDDFLYNSLQIMI